MADSLPSDILAALARAEATGHTDEEQRQFDACRRIFLGIQELVEKEVVAKNITTTVGLRAIATTLGGIINANTTSRIGAAVVATELVKIVLEAATMDHIK